APSTPQTERTGGPATIWQCSLQTTGLGSNRSVPPSRPRKFSTAQHLSADEVAVVPGHDRVTSWPIVPVHPYRPRMSFSARRASADQCTMLDHDRVTVLVGHSDRALRTGSNG